ncbi:hypothetical protein [Amycolatopsis pittospori]|uniref:hypothetical protein n=1 Tax=Amycolatopsis pittospori TaxID=2749434 RepID=UPI0015F0D998|nr:hypothetical protein [Amycolatopsis pittospori]
MNHLSIDELLEELRRRRWVVYIFGPREEPEVCAAVFQWETCADVLVLRGEERASAYRVTTLPDTDVFQPALVSWQYHSTADWTLRAVLTIPPPGDVAAPIQLLQPHPDCAIPMDARQPVTILPANGTGKADQGDP